MTNHLSLPSFATLLENLKKPSLEHPFVVPSSPPLLNSVLNLKPTSPKKHGTLVGRFVVSSAANSGRAFTQSNNREGHKCSWKDCGITFETLHQLGKHVVDHLGTGKGTYICKWDGCVRLEKPFTKRHKILNHLRTHTGERPFRCLEPGCHRYFSRADSLATHARTHSNLRPFPCPLMTCSRQYYHSRSLRKHLIIYAKRDLEHAHVLQRQIKFPANNNLNKKSSSSGWKIMTEYDGTIEEDDEDDEEDEIDEEDEDMETCTPHPLSIEHIMDSPPAPVRYHPYNHNTTATNNNFVSGNNLSPPPRQHASYQHRNFGDDRAFLQSPNPFQGAPAARFPSIHQLMMQSQYSVATFPPATQQWCYPPTTYVTGGGHNFMPAGGGGSSSAAIFVSAYTGQSITVSLSRCASSTMMMEVEEEGVKRVDSGVLLSS